MIIDYSRKLWNPAPIWVLMNGQDESFDYLLSYEVIRFKQNHSLLQYMMKYRRIEVGVHRLYLIKIHQVESLCSESAMFCTQV